MMHITFSIKDKYSYCLQAIIFTMLTLGYSLPAISQHPTQLLNGNGQKTELNSGWFFKKATELSAGKTLGKWGEAGQKLKDWEPATVPGTILTSLLNNKKIPDPFYAMNNNRIPDIFNTGRDYYTYWFVKDFQLSDISDLKKGDQYFLHLRGVNYGFDAYLNGHRLNPKTLKGMFIRRSFNITKFLSNKGLNRLAIIVYPPDPVGNPNGGQGGDGTIAKNVAHQYVAGWDWIQPVRDRNTGIWDKIWITKQGAVQLMDPHIVTQVPGKRMPDDPHQAPAIIVSALTLHNSSNKQVTGTASFSIDGRTIKKYVSLNPGEIKEVHFDPDTIIHPRLWWPNGMGILNPGEQGGQAKASRTGDDHPTYNINNPNYQASLYLAGFRFTLQDEVISDSLSLQVGIRQLTHRWNDRTRSMEVLVNGQPLFIRGGNWIVSDAMLRLSKERYDAEVRFHRDMGLNLIRVWGGALTERPEFYQACDKYGLLVMQDFWGSGDCNGRWQDPKKKDDIWTRRDYPDDHTLFLASAADQIRMLRNHSSLAIWCGGNEITLAPDLQNGLQDSLLPLLDTTRWYIDFSNSDSMSFNTLGGNGDGPYGIQSLKTFWAHRTYPFNSEIGSVGIGDSTSLARFLPKSSLPVRLPEPDAKNGYDHTTLIDSVWQYHKYIGYDHYINKYGKPGSVSKFAQIAQLINYNQYRALMEGFTAHQWDWYTGFIIWKTQNPWTAMRGQMYDYYLDPNSCLYGLKKGAEKIHLMFNPADSGVYIVNNTYKTVRNLVMDIKVSHFDGDTKLITRTITQAIAQHPKLLLKLSGALSRPAAAKGLLLSLRLLDLHKNIVSNNIYWTSDADGNYSGLQDMAKATVAIKANWTINKAGQKQITVRFTNPARAVPAFFNRISLVNKVSGKRILPSFYSDNYITLLPGDSSTIYIDPPNTSLQSTLVHPNQGKAVFTPTKWQDMQLAIEGWNLPEKKVPIE